MGQKNQNTLFRERKKIREDNILICAMPILRDRKRLDMPATQQACKRNISRSQSSVAKPLPATSLN